MGFFLPGEGGGLTLSNSSSFRLYGLIPVEGWRCLENDWPSLPRQQEPGPLITKEEEE